MNQDPINKGKKPDVDYENVLKNIEEIFGKKQQVKKEAPTTPKVNPSGEKKDVNLEKWNTTVANRTVTQEPKVEQTEERYPQGLQNKELERIYIGLLLNNPKAIEIGRAHV